MLVVSEAGLGMWWILMDANGSCGCDAGTGFVAMQNLPESEDDDEEEGDEEIEVQMRRELRCMQLFYAVLHEFMMTGCMLAFFLCLIMHDMHVHFQRVSIATCCHHVGFCGTAGHAGLDLCPVEAPSAHWEEGQFFTGIFNLTAWMTFLDVPFLL